LLILRLLKYNIYIFFKKTPPLGKSTTAFILVRQTLYFSIQLLKFWENFSEIEQINTHFSIFPRDRLRYRNPMRLGVTSVCCRWQTVFGAHANRSVVHSSFFIIFLLILLLLLLSSSFRINIGPANEITLSRPKWNTVAAITVVHAFFLSFTRRTIFRNARFPSSVSVAFVRGTSFRRVAGYAFLFVAVTVSWTDPTVDVISWGDVFRWTSRFVDRSLPVCSV